MIDKEQINIDWITRVAKANRNADKILVEKVIRALSLLEGLVQFKIPFVFKGGTSLMLHFKSPTRLSIDIDIIIEEKIENFNAKLETIAKTAGFNRIKLQHRPTPSKIDKAHYKYFYTPIHKTAKDEEYILLDILFEEIAYSKNVDVPITSSFAPSKGEPAIVKIPGLEDLLGDKLTAFAPNTTGIPYFKGDDSMSMEIIKQLYDIGNLFDASTDLGIVRTTFMRFAKTELAYRYSNDKTQDDVLEDIFQTPLCLASKGMLGVGNFEELRFGIKRINGFIFSENYHIEKAIVSASKAAYLSALMTSSELTFDKFKNPKQVKDWNITQPEYNKLNKLKKSNPEAFFYWYKTIELKTNKDK